MRLFLDVRYALRALVRSPGFTAVSLLMLGLAIGANTAIFQMIDAVMLQQLPVREPTRLARLEEPSFAYPSYLSLQTELVGAHGAVFEGLLAVSRQPVHAEIDGFQESVVVAPVSGNFFSVLGVRPARGRMIDPSDDMPGADNAIAVIGHEYWRQRFGSQPTVIGRRIVLNRVPYTIVGVAEKGFDGPFIGSPTALYLPIASYGRLNHTRADEWRKSYRWSWLHILARLAPGVTLEQANAAVKATWPRLHTGRDTARNVFLSDGSGGISGLRRQYGQALKVLFGATGLILLLTCANLANLLLARMTGRSSEGAIRLSLGASRAQLLRGYFFETLLLCAVGAALGWLVSIWTVDLLTASLSGPANEIRLNVEANARTLGFSAAVCLLTAVLFGLAPAIWASRQDPAALLQHHARAVGDRTGFLGRALVTLQIAISVCLLSGAALLSQTLYRLTSQPAGFRPEGVLHVDLNLIDAAYEKAGMLDFYQRLSERIGGLFGTEAVGVAWKHPIGGGGWTSAYRWSSGPVEWQSNGPNTYVNVIGPGYFAAIGTPVLAGREFSWGDSASRPMAAVINDALARKHWPQTNAIGRWIELEGGSRYEIVGVVQSSPYRTYYQTPPPTVFLSFQQMPDSISGIPLSLVVRSTRPEQLAPAVRRVISELDPKLPADMELLTTRLRRTVVRERLLAGLSVVLAALAVVITVIGLYGVVAFQLRRRTRELGLRIALGATPQSLAAATVRDGMRFLAIGLPVGLLLAYVASRFMMSLLVGIQPYDPLTYIAVCALLAAATLAACWLPARGILRADPGAALRYE